MMSAHAGPAPFFSPSGRLPPQTFVVAVGLVYLAGARVACADLRRISSRAPGFGRFLPRRSCSFGSGTRCTPSGFATAESRLGWPPPSSVLYALSVALLVILAVAFYGPLAGQGTDANTASALGLDPLRVDRRDAGRHAARRFGLADRRDLVAARLSADRAGDRDHRVGGDAAKRGRACRVIFHFAYGSNMSRAVMRRHAPGAEAVGVATLANYRFLITTHGHASVAPLRAKTVYGVLWRLTPRDCVTLDAWENIAGGLYRAESLPVRQAGRRRFALVYLARSQEEAPPQAGYMEL